MGSDVKIDREGLQNVKTGERSQMILPSELEVLILPNFTSINSYAVVQRNFRERQWWSSLESNSKTK